MVSPLEIPASDLLQAVWENAPNGLILYQVTRDALNEPVDFRYALVNREAAALLGAQPEDIIGQSCRIIFPQGEVLRANYRQVARTGQTAQLDYELPTDGRWFDVRITCPQPDLLLCFFSDITARHRFQADLLMENRRLNEAQTIGQVGSFEWNLGESLVNWSDELYRIHGLAPQSQPITINMTNQFFHPEDQPALERLKQQCFHSPGAYGLIHRSRRVDGRVIWVNHQFESIADATGQVVRVHGTVQDITAYRQTQRQLQESEQRFRELAENVDALFWIRDVAARGINYLNPVFETFTGIPVEAVYRNPKLFFAAVIPEDQPLIEAARQSQDVSATFQFRIRHRTGRLRWLTVRTFSIFNEQGQLIRRIGVATDTTALVEKGQILEESLRREQALTALQAQFITTASHEFRTPLTAISSSVELLQHYLGQLPTHPVLPAMARHLTAILTKMELLNTLLGDTLSISQLDEGQVKVCWQALEVMAYCQGLIQTTFGERADQRRVEVSLQGEAKPVETDPKLLSHILVNLVSNAFKFSRQNPRLTIRFEAAQVELAVSDRGIGIPADELAQVFGRFFRARNAADYQGTGLGLVICQEYASLLGGQLTVSSQVGVGTQFTLRLPLQKASLPGES